MKIRFVSELYKAKQNIRGILDAAKNAALQCSLLVSRSFSGTSFVRNPCDAQCNAMHIAQCNPLQNFAVSFMSLMKMYISTKVVAKVF